MMLKINTNFKKRIGWSFTILTTFGLFSYLTFIPNQTFAESLIVDPNEHRSLSQIGTMQEMSQQICINSRENETKQLRDTRDDKTYWVTKLKDGNCWMTQNLGLDLSTSKTLTPSDTDIKNNWTPNNSTRTGNISSGWASTQTAVESWNLGTYYYVMDADWTNCGNDKSVANLSSCNKWSTSAPATEGEHYHVGNYYSWNAATAGTGESITSGQAKSSICPNGWKLPTSNNINKGSFSYLMDQYNIINANIKDKLRQTPLYFIPAGNVVGDGLNVAGNRGIYWSSTPDSYAHLAYRFEFLPNALYPSNSNHRYVGLSVRCLAEGGDFPDPILDDNQASVSITVSPVISIDVTKHADDMAVDFTSIARSSIIARVGSNQGYQVLISTEQSNLEQSPVVENQHIPMITNDQKISAGNKAWGISKDITVVSSTGTTISNPTIDTNTIYSPIGLGENKALFYTSNTPASEDLTFPVAIAVDSTLPSGKYSTQVTLTAVAM